MVTNQLNIIERLKAPTSAFFKKVRNIGLGLTAVGGGNSCHTCWTSGNSIHCGWLPRGCRWGDDGSRPGDSRKRIISYKNLPNEFFKPGCSPGFFFVPNINGGG